MIKIREKLVWTKLLCCLTDFQVAVKYVPIRTVIILVKKKRIINTKRNKIYTENIFTYEVYDKYFRSIKYRACRKTTVVCYSCCHQQEPRPRILYAPRGAVAAFGSQVRSANIKIEEKKKTKIKKTSTGKPRQSVRVAVFCVCEFKSVIITLPESRAAKNGRARARARKK